MKLVFQANREEDAREIKVLLEANGIPAALSGEFTFGALNIGIPRVIGVWVYLDRQAPEAERLIENPEYEVSDPVDVEEFYRLSESEAVKQAVLTRMLKVTALAFVGLLLLVWLLAILFQ